MVDMDMASLGYWLDIQGSFFTMEHKMRFVRWMMLCLLINLSQTSMMYMLFVEEIDYSLSINEGLKILNQGFQKGTAITEEFDAAVKENYQDTVNELFEIDQGSLHDKMVQFVIMVMTGFIVQIYIIRAVHFNAQILL